jgi:SOS-response transcriptional repressor LexA
MLYDVHEVKIMKYADLLDKLIQQSGITAKDLAQKCQDLGIDITPSYISLLRNKEKNRVPSDDVSIALAKALGKPDNYLVLEGYLEAAPIEVKQAIENMYLQSVTIAAWVTGTPLIPEQEQAIKAVIKQQPMADMIFALAQQVSIETLEQTFMSTKIENSTVTLVMPQELNVEDNDMYPLMEKGNRAKLITKNEYDNGDIVVISLDDNSYKYRKLQKISEELTLLLAFNPECETMSFDEKTMVIIGKVDSVTKRL